MPVAAAVNQGIGAGNPWEMARVSDRALPPGYAASTPAVTSVSSC